jgi:GR25 family glycosyltransferase involved in LPS biosynthesis
MKAFVISVKEIEESVKSAQRCISSASDYGIDVEMFFGVTPKDNPLEIIKNLGISPEGFYGKFSRFENSLSAFLSHYRLWEKSIEMNEEVLIFEHDAVVTSQIHIFKPYNKLISYGKPSYGKYNTPLKIGVNPLSSKRYLPGAHAYRLKPEAAKIIIEKAKVSAEPTDIFLNLNNFPWIEEYYPWPVEVIDNFTTIQKTEGCLAKHNYKEGYKIL